MKAIKRLILATVIASFSTTIYAGCLNDYNNALRDCNNAYPSSFTLAGCRADALAGYYGCILMMATS